MEERPSPGGAIVAIDGRLLRRRFVVTAAVLLVPLLAATSASVAYHRASAVHSRYVVALSQLTEAMSRIDVHVLSHDDGADDGHADDHDAARDTFRKALTLYAALRAADPDGAGILEADGAHARSELGRLMTRHGIDPTGASRASGLLGNEMPGPLEAVWEEEDGWRAMTLPGASLEAAFGAKLLAAAPMFAGDDDAEATAEATARRRFQAASDALPQARLAEVAEVLQREARVSARAPVLLALAVLGIAAAALAFAYALVVRPLGRHILLVQDELQREALAAKAADRAKSEFLATMSHEIRTPMNGVLGMAQLLDGTRLDERQRLLTDVILQSGQRLLRVINDILDVSKVDAGALALDPRPFRLSRMVNEPARLVAHLAQQKGLALAVRVEPGLPSHVVGDPDRLQQVVVNLVGNAVKFTEAGRVYVNLTGSGSGCVGEPHRLRVEVEDTGPGMPADRVGDVFSKFTQIDGTSTRRHEGTGLGLAIAKGLVEAMGGRTGVRSAPGRGSVFWFEVELPVAEGKPAAAVAPVHAAGARVLSIDDDETNRFVVRELLRSWGLGEASAASGREGLQLLGNAARRGEAFDVVILDHHMPGMSGPQVIEAIRRDAALSGTAVVLLSSVEDGRDPAGRAAAPDVHLVKPAPASTLFDALMTALAAAADRRAGGREEGPAAEAMADGAAPSDGAPDPGPDLPQGVVLLVEDNRFNRVVVRQILAGAPVRIVEAQDGAEALSLAAEHHPDLILMDVSMPVMDGLEATRRLRERERVEGLPRTPIWGLTAHALPADRARCVEAGMDDHLPKPIDVGRLRDVVAGIVERRREAA